MYHRGLLRTYYKSLLRTYYKSNKPRLRDSLMSVPADHEQEGETRSAILPPENMVPSSVKSEMTVTGDTG